uniref:lysyl oxidase homolog 4-like isoform X1 n=1 Tax=Styela clava TaxID=7725 RepID=UPI00193A161D|nr:lysyl oxidase homolog 4-like isoform X1 [Styela clava]
MSVGVIALLIALKYAPGSAEPTAENIRLRGGPTVGQGKVEVSLDGRWGALCSNHWTMNEANVVCRQLGYERAIAALRESYYGEARGPIWYQSVRCTGSENALHECRRVRISKKIAKKSYENVDEIRECSYRHQAGVVCEEPINPDKDKIVLTEALIGIQYQIVLVEHEGERYPICNKTFTSKEAIVACRQSAGKYAKLVGQISRKSPDIGVTYPSAVFLKPCTGKESSLQECGIDFVNGCDEYATVVCDIYAPDIMVNITRLQNSIELKYKAEFRMECAWEEGCMGEESLNKTKVMIKSSTDVRRLLVFSSYVQNFGNADFRPPGMRNLWHFHECHKHYHSITDFALYELRSKDDGNVVRVGHKVSFCLRDNSCVNRSRKRYNCHPLIRDGDQGISIGCSDHYTNKLDCQWIDVTNVPSGPYTLEIRSNPYLLVPEQDYSNNHVVCDINLGNQIVEGTNCRYPDDFEVYDD